MHTLAKFNGHAKIVKSLSSLTMCNNAIMLQVKQSCSYRHGKEHYPLHNGGYCGRTSQMEHPYTVSPWLNRIEDYCHTILNSMEGC